jgi:hypothetical protein
MVTAGSAGAGIMQNSICCEALCAQLLAVHSAIPPAAEGQGTTGSCSSLQRDDILRTNSATLLVHTAAHATVFDTACGFLLSFCCLCC